MSLKLISLHIERFPHLQRLSVFPKKKFLKERKGKKKSNMAQWQHNYLTNLQHNSLYRHLSAAARRTSGGSLQTQQPGAPGENPVRHSQSQIIGVVQGLGLEL